MTLFFRSFLLLCLFFPTLTAGQTVELKSLSLNPAGWDFRLTSDQKTFSATAHYSDGSAVTPYTAVAWKSSNQRVAVVNSAGRVLAASKGSSTITATSIESNLISADATVTVSLIINRIEILPSSLRFTAAEQSVSAVVRAYQPDNAVVMPYTNVVWWTESETVATVTPAGVVTSQGAGLTHLMVRSIEDQSLTASALITVAIQSHVVAIDVLPMSGFISGIGGQCAFRARAYLADSRIVDPYEAVDWTSGDSCVASVNATGVATSRGGGTASIIARVKGAPTITSSGKLDVEAPDRVEYVFVEPDSWTFQTPGQTKTFSASALLCDGSVIPGYLRVIWQSSDTSIVSVNATTGLAAALKKGSARVLVTSLDFPSATGESFVTVSGDEPLPLETAVWRDWLLARSTSPPADANGDGIGDAADLVFSLAER